MGYRDRTAQLLFLACTGMTLCLGPPGSRLLSALKDSTLALLGPEPLDPHMRARRHGVTPPLLLLVSQGTKIVHSYTHRRCLLVKLAGVAETRGQTPKAHIWYLRVAPTQGHGTQGRHGQADTGQPSGLPDLRYSTSVRYTVQCLSTVELA